MFKKIINIISTVILIVLIIIVIFIFYAKATGNVPEILGYQVYRISSGSMSPTLEIGDVILSRRVDPSQIHTGDIITYLGTQGDFQGKLITHEVIEEPVLEDGGYVIRTQGVAKGTSPDPPVDGSQVKGRFVCRLSFLNSLYTFFLSPLGLITFILVIIALFGYELISLILSYKALDEKTDALYPDDKSKTKNKK